VETPAKFGGPWRRAPREPVPYAHELYANLRALDATGAAQILIEAVPADEAWFAITDRLRRAVHAEHDDRD
jgi:L-threonylcarbamoyladenylate synthase